jgi:hypothetical protein
MQVMQGLVEWMSRIFFTWIQRGVSITVVLWILVVLPMLLFRKARPVAVSILLYSSLYTGFACWWFSFIVSYNLFGGVGLLIGLLIAGIGVVPLAIFGLAINGQWLGFWNLILAVGLVFGPRALAGFAMYRHAAREEAEAAAQRSYISFTED